MSIGNFDKIGFLDDNKCGNEIVEKWNEAEKLASKYPIAITTVGDKTLRGKMQSVHSGLLSLL